MSGEEEASAPGAGGSESSAESGAVAVQHELATNMDVLVDRVGPDVRPSDVNDVLRLRESDARLSRLRVVLNAWELQQGQERSLRDTYAKAFLVALAIELALIFAAFFLSGLDIIKSEKWAVEAFLIAALTQTTGLALVIVKYLFPQRSTDLLQLVEKTVLKDPGPGEKGNV